MRDIRIRDIQPSTAHVSNTVGNNDDAGIDFGGPAIRSDPAGNRK